MVETFSGTEKRWFLIPAIAAVRKSYKKALAASTIYKFDPEAQKNFWRKPAGSRGRTAFTPNSKGERMNLSFALPPSERTTMNRRKPVIAELLEKNRQLHTEY